MFPIYKTIKITPSSNAICVKYCHSVFDIHKLLKRDTVSRPFLTVGQPESELDIGREKVEQPHQFKVCPVVKELQPAVINIIKEHYFKAHVFVRYRCIDIMEDHTIDEYLKGVLKQGNSLCATSEDGIIAGVCVNFINTPVEVNNLKQFAYYRQDVNIKDLLCFLAKLDEIPNLWKTLQQDKIFELKMLTVLPEFRRQGLAMLLAEKSKELALDEGHKCVRMNCINENDYKIAERCMFNCIAKYPLHKVSSATKPYIKQDSTFNRYLRVYVNLLKMKDCQIAKEQMKMCQINLDECLQ